MYLSIRNYFYHFFVRNPRKWRPLLAVQYLTYRCEFRCPYCCDGKQRPYWTLPQKDIPVEEMARILSIVRRNCDYLVLTGGEPLSYPHLHDLLPKISALRFDGVIFTTNGREIEKHLDRLAPHVRYLVFSLDTMDAAKADRWYGAEPGAHKKILEGIAAARDFPGRRYEIIISAVAGPENLDDLFNVYQYCKESGFRFAVCPVLQGVKPHPTLRDNPSYLRFFDHLIAEKKRGAAINGTVQYLRYMRDLKKFNCRPATTLAVSPEGQVFYPCLEIGENGGRLLDFGNLDRLSVSAAARFGPAPKCDNRCQSACALGFSLLLSNPETVMYETYLLFKSRLSIIVRHLFFRRRGEKNPSDVL